MRSETEHSKPSKVLNSNHLIFDYEPSSFDNEESYTSNKDESDRNLVLSAENTQPFELSTPTPGMMFKFEQGSKWQQPVSSQKLLSFEQAQMPL